MVQKPIQPIGPEEIVYQGKIHEIVEQRMRTGEKEQVFEFARRSPGVRLIIPSSSSSLILTKEYRHEVRGFDVRLPGGKVFDTLQEYNSFLKSGVDIVSVAGEAAKKEAREEVGIEVEEIQYYYTSKEASATLVYDLLYFVVTRFHKRSDGQSLEHGEDIELVEVSFEEARKMCLDGRMQEDRSAAVLIRFFHSHNV